MTLCNLESLLCITEMCKLNERLDSTITHKYLKFSTYSISSPLKHKASLLMKLYDIKSISLVLLIFGISLLLLNSHEGKSKITLFIQS